MTNDTIKLRIKDIRTYYGNTQQELANILGVSRSTYTGYETDEKVSISVRNLVKISNFYNISLNYLFGLTDEFESTIINEYDSKFVAERIRIIRLKERMNITQFAKRLNMGISTIRNYEIQRNDISIALCYKLAHCFNISIDYILGKSETKFLKK